MRNGDGDAALRFSIVVAVASFIALTAGLYEIDRREKSTSATRERSLSEIEQRLQNLGDQIHILSSRRRWPPTNARFRRSILKFRRSATNTSRG